ncbi:unnamed protein product [Ectocarpus sp. 12 AP-2014]
MFDNNTEPVFDSIMSSLPQFALSIIIIAGFLVIWLIARTVIAKIFDKKLIKLKHHIALSIVRTIGALIWIIAMLVLLGIWGIDISSLLTGLGLTGFALKDVLAGSIAGILILFYQPFKMKSKISVMGVEGIVIDIDMRYTTIEDDLGKHLIPNSKILSEKVTILKKQEHT